MWENFSQRLSISIIYAFITETACVNNSKKELDYNRKLLQISLIIIQCPLQKNPEWAGLTQYGTIYGQLLRGTNLHEKSEKAHFYYFIYGCHVIPTINLMMQNLMWHNRSVQLSQSPLLENLDNNAERELKTPSAGQQQRSLIATGITDNRCSHMAMFRPCPHLNSFHARSLVLATAP